jgi:hypothetical protein
MRAKTSLVNGERSFSKRSATNGGREEVSEIERPVQRQLHADV